MAKPRASSPPPVSAAEPSRECRRCHQWESAPADVYCGFCGRLLLELSVRPDSLVLISGIAPSRELTLTNEGPDLLQAVLVPTSSSLPALEIEPAGPLTLPPGATERVVIRLDAGALPLGFREATVQYVCLVDDDRRKALPVSIVVRSGPRPQALPPALEFGEFREGTVAKKTLTLRNQGGTPLQVREVRTEGSSRLRLAAKIALPARVDPGRELPIPVVWDGRLPQKGADAGEAGVRLAFGNYPEALYVPARAKLYQYQLQFDRAHLYLPAALSKQDYIERVQLKNEGNVDVEIEGIDASPAWIRVVSPVQRFTLLCRDSTQLAAPTALREVFPFQVVCYPKDLDAGWHTGKVVVRSAGQEPKTLEVRINVIRPKTASDYIGIDFGTTNSVIAVQNEQTQTVDLVEDGPEGHKSPLIPSVLAFLGPDVYRIGHEARNEAAVAPERVVRSIKRAMGYDHDWEFFGRRFSPEELASRIIRKLVELAETRLYEMTGTYYDIRKAILTVPANFFDLQIRGVLRAAAEAGLDIEEEQVRRTAQAMKEALHQEVNAGVILDEPSAAALYYLSYLEEHGRDSELLKVLAEKGRVNLLVFDYGGGTLDVSVANVVRLEQGALGLRVLANMGNNRIGGDSIDLLLLRELAERCHGVHPAFDPALITAVFKEIDGRRQKEDWNPQVWSRILGARSAWKDLAEQAKIELAGRRTTNVLLAPPWIVQLEAGEVRSAPREFSTLLEHSDLERLLEGTLQECETLVDSALGLAKLKNEGIDYVLHTGRQSLLPLIRERVQRLFPKLPPGRNLLEQKHLKVCVAKGAALYGLMRGRLRDPSSGVHLLSEGRLLPHSYGTERFTGISRREFEEILPKGTPYPTAVERHYDTEARSLHLKFYQNRGGRKTIAGNSEMSLVGQVTLDPMADGKPGCDVRFLIDANRKLEVSADGVDVEILPVRLKDDESWIG